MILELEIEYCGAFLVNLNASWVYHPAQRLAGWQSAVLAYPLAVLTDDFQKWTMTYAIQMVEIRYEPIKPYCT